ncbi:MAG: hypothetical protein IJE28_02665 [Oscillospiraceae bacterium]|nr:hypothetical protein [Oscillospiraceae bacterium]MBQ4643209.1 hypothetical protein [Oscillospiraceae bacterium]
MSEFIKSALPFVLIGISIAIFAVDYHKNHKDRDSEAETDFSAMGPLFGVAAGIAIGTANESIGAGLGAGIGMFAGTIIEFLIHKNR